MIYMNTHNKNGLVNMIKEDKIKYVIGDATAPEGEGGKIIIHCCNDIGAWGAGFVMALSRKWKEPQEVFIKHNDSLGHVNYARVEDDIVVANMVGQRSTVLDDIGRPPIRYGAIELCLEQVAHKAKRLGYSVHAPRFGSDLAGGKWDKIEALIYYGLIARGISVTIYDLPVPPPKQVIVMRNKFPDGNNGMRKLRTGKMVAQGAHASLAPILNQMNNYKAYSVPIHSIVGTTLGGGDVFGISNMEGALKDWIEGRFTKVVVSVETEEELLEIHRQAEEAGLPCALITDAGLTEFGNVATHTCVGIGPASAADIDKITGKLPLL